MLCQELTCRKNNTISCTILKVYNWGTILYTGTENYELRSISEVPILHSTQHLHFSVLIY